MCLFLFFLLDLKPKEVYFLLYCTNLVLQNSDVEVLSLDNVIVYLLIFLIGLLRVTQLSYSVQFTVILR